MGKRRERRLAAKMAANRRVKLDIFADPSGDMLGTSAHEVGGDTDQEKRAVVPTSPSSSGQGQENPLLLLGQYSDDELEEETSKRPKVDADGCSSDVPDPDAVEPAEDFGGPEKDIDGDKQLLERVGTVENVDNHEGKDDESTYAEYSETDPVKQVNEPEPSGIQVNGDFTGFWKLVMHEESNQYYYWNTVTGETSWEVSAVLAGLTVSGGEAKVSHIDAHLSSESAMDAYASTVDGLDGCHVSSVEAIECNDSLGSKNENGELAFVVYDANQALTDYINSTASISYANQSVLPNFGSSLQANAVSMGTLTAPVAGYHSSSEEEDKDKHIANSTDCYGTADVHSSHLVKCCESLLQRLEVLDRYGSRLEGHEWITKEIEVRLSDCKALSPYGSSLLPFWWYIEGQLKQLESAVRKGEASLIVPDKHNDDLETIQSFHLREACSLQCIETRSEIMENEEVIASSVKNSCSSPIPESLVFQIETTRPIPDIENAKTEGLSSACHEHLGSEQEPHSFPEAKPNTASVAPEVESHTNEDVDMDVEMEIDEEPVNDSPSTLEKLDQLDQSNQPDTEYPPLPTDEPGVPSPLDEEWIPPPPPDDEPIPPPPPEEPPLPSVPPACPDTILCPPYSDQYNIGYTVPAYDYYSSTAGSTGDNYYAQAEGSQISETQPPSYYDPAGTNGIHEVAVAVNPVEAAAYYGVSNGAIPSGPVVSSVVSSGYYVEAGPFNYLGSVPTSDHSGSVGYTLETGNNVSLLSKLNPELKALSTVTVPLASNLQASFVPSSTQSRGSTVSNGSAVDPLPAVSSNHQAKATVRRKKHTVAVAPSLRSNKKVSSLVDKWKAAKEDLHSEEDEEPESTLELLGKKRQKEIEEWRARQIASGEAQDNANFLPLGGDWRERVKRKKAKAKCEAVQTPTETADNENQQPNLVELSKDLPSGWQAYWDESSKGVYYGNNITSATTWTRPTR